MSTSPIAESLKSILVIAEQSRNTENACDLIAKIATDALTRPSPSADDGDVEGLRAAEALGLLREAKATLSPFSVVSAPKPTPSHVNAAIWKLQEVERALTALSAAPTRAAPAGDREGLKRIQAEAFLAGYEAANAGPGAFGVVRAYPGFLNGFVCGDDEENAENLSLMLALPAAPQAPVSAPIADGGFE